LATAKSLAFLAAAEALATASLSLDCKVVCKVVDSRYLVLMVYWADDNSADLLLNLVVHSSFFLVS